MLYWVGCMGSFDERNRRCDGAVAKVLQAADVDFAILGPEETCTGDPARRIGNEYLWQMLAQQNIETLNGYGFNADRWATGSRDTGQAGSEPGSARSSPAVRTASTRSRTSTRSSAATTRSSTTPTSSTD